MSYRVRFTTQTGATGYWEGTFATHAGASMSAQTRADVTGYTYTVEEVPDAPEPTSTTEQLVSLFRDLHGGTSTTEQLVSLFRDLHGGQQTVPNEADGVEYVPGVKPEPTSTTDRLVGLLRDRHARGLAKYGTTLDRTDLTPEQWAQHAIEEALDFAGYLMRLKDGFAPEPGSTAAHHVEILRTRVNVLEALVEARGKAVTDAHVANHAMHRDLAFALQIGDAMREAMRTGEWRAGHDRSMANSATAGWDRWKPSLAKAPSASEAPGECGDSDRRRLEVLKRFLDGDDAASLTWHEGEFHAVAEDVAITAPTLLALADKLMEKEAKP